MIMKNMDSTAHPLTTKPKKKISSLMSSQASGTMNMSRISDSRIMSNVFIMLSLFVMLQIYEIVLKVQNKNEESFCERCQPVDESGEAGII